jgi:hypothetical protein
MCDCLEKVNADLEPKGVMVWSTIPLSGRPSKPLLPLIRLDTREMEKRRGKPKMVAASCCPWCGERYQEKSDVG